MAPQLGVFGYPDHSGSGNLNLDNLVAGGGIYIFSDGTTLTFQASGPYLTYDVSNIADARVLKAGANVIFDTTTPGELTIVAQATGGTGAGTDLSYVTISTEPSLSNERRLAAGNGITITDNGANSTVDVGLSSSLTGATFVTVGSETLLTGERRLTVAGGLDIYDNGANSTLTITASSLQYTGTTSTASTVSLTIYSTRVQLADCTSNAITYNLPAASTATDKIFIFKKVDGTANSVTLDPSGSETIDGVTTYTIPIPLMAVELYCSGSAWYLI